VTAAGAWLLLLAVLPGPEVAASAGWLLSPAAADAALAERVVEVSARMLGTPYIHSPLGEGEGKDPDPPLRFDAVDCLTYVEQVLALSLARSPDDAPRILGELRYGARPTYEDRNHLMEAQWLPNNVQKGYLRPVTRALGGKDAQRATKVVTAESWASESSRALDLPPSHQVTGTFELDVVPLGKVLEHARAAKAGTVAVIVREERVRKVTRVTHLGFIVHRKGRPVLRHAARSHYRRVVDEDLETFLLRNSKYDKWPVTGFSFYEVKAPPDDEAPRVAERAAP
jgi:hypothetical protein